jgi:hypothetical protein
MLRIPSMRGMIDRRILANWRVDPAVLARLVPPPFRPQIVGGFGIAGVCLIRLKQIGPAFLPAMFGLSSENAAPRIAVEWQVYGEIRRGVYVPRRDTNSRFNSLLGGRLFPGRSNPPAAVESRPKQHHTERHGSVPGKYHLTIDIPLS